VFSGGEGNWRYIETPLEWPSASRVVWMEGDGGDHETVAAGEDGWKSSCF